MRRVIALSLLPFVSGCISLPELNADIKNAWAHTTDETVRMRSEARPLSRPLVILGGYRTIPLHASGLAGTLVQLTSGRSSDVLVLSFPLSSDMDSMARRTIAAIERRWPSDDPEQTVDVDVIGVCMGGLLARWAALPEERRVRAESAQAVALSPRSTPEPGTPMGAPETGGQAPAEAGAEGVDELAEEGGPAGAGEAAGPEDRGETKASTPGRSSSKRLRIARLFTISAPHQGAQLARMFGLDKAARDMRPNSGMIRTLDAELPQAEYELICYAQRNDPVLGDGRAAPPGHPTIETAGTVGLSHLSAASNRVFIVDIARRLRNEPPLIGGARGEAQ